MASDRSTTDFASGMQRSGAIGHLDFTSIHPIAMIALARTLGGEGSVKYGRMNYTLGSPVYDNLNHVQYHIEMYKAGDRSEPHLEHALTGMMFAVVNDTLYPELNRPHQLGPGCTVTPEVIAHLEAGKPERQRRREAGEFDHLGEWKLSEVPEIKTILDQREAERVRVALDDMESQPIGPILDSWCKAHPDEALSSLSSAELLSIPPKRLTGANDQEFDGAWDLADC